MTTQAQPEVNAPLRSTNPADNYATLGDVPVTYQTEINTKIALSRQAATQWATLPLSNRVDALRPLGPLIEKYADEIATRTSREMGMDRALSNALVKRSVEELEWTLNNAHTALDPVTAYESESEINRIVREPYGVIACIAPWNFPIANFIGNVAPALLGGNSMIIKFSEEIVLLSAFLEEMMQGLNLPDHLLQFVHGDGHVGAQLVDGEVDFIMFTGSFRTGHELTKKAAEKFIPIVTELGGSSPGLVFADADLDRVIPDIYSRRFANCGQFCSGLKRLIVERPVFDTVCDRLVEHAQKQTVGNPLHDGTTMGPLVAQRQLEALESQIRDAKQKGATILTGGKRPEGLQGAYYEPTLLTNITTDMAVWREEVFGPALPIVAFDTLEEAVTLAHDTDYGLSAYVYTQDTQRTQTLMHRLQAGTVATEGTNSVRPQNPFGGYKHSGMGRVRGLEGFHDVTRTKLVAWKK